MSALVRAEFFKLRTTRAAFGIFAAMLGLVLLVVLVHGLGLAADRFATVQTQRSMLFGWGQVFGALFAALLGATAITSEIRHGTIRPTLLVTPWRHRVVLAKASAGLLVGVGFGAVGGGLAASVGSLALWSRGIDIRLDRWDFVLVMAAGAVSAALWSVIGVGVGALVRSQVPALLGITIWLLFVENLLVGDIAGVGTVGRLLPGAAGKAVLGQQGGELLSPGAGLAVLAMYAAVIEVAGCLSFNKRDVA